MWVFGYGSLIWKVDFPYSQRVIGYIKGYKRRFWQASIDHRGTEEKPGRVVTLIPSEDPEECVWGVAYEIPPDVQKNVLISLDYREKGGYVRTETVLHPEKPDMMPMPITIYIGEEDNPFYAKGRNDEIAEIIASAVGPSGSNKEYFFKLVSSVKTLGIHDSHLFDIEAKVQSILDKA
ncbi:putative glutathione-specific gamma-glutamylcyclotransferase 2 isoform X2 [Oratosquilla oratoria]|uniref:putative glutathione-specific gamma-glutamylcyclotransferase 2 isoform X2 n=1 Tax=Oratosquilla oratoria TaxID=337810 RepID=UPI003F764F9A